MKLQVSQLALQEAFKRQGRDINKATHQEMRSLVCAQCHVEYYFKGDKKYLTFPWDKGMTIEKMEEYYDADGWTDYVHPLSRTPILKAQHPDYELSQLGIHGQRGVSCADCHMPYKTDGAVKFTDHQISSPLRNVSASCQTCHRQSEEELVKNVYDRQDAVYGMRMKLEKQLAKVHFKAKFLWDNGATEEQMKPTLALIRKSQWRWDMVHSSHGAAFHAPIESERLLSDGLIYAYQAENNLDVLKEKLNTIIDLPTVKISNYILGLNEASRNFFFALDYAITIGIIITSSTYCYNRLFPKSKMYLKKLNEFKIQTEERFTKFEKAIENVDSLKEEIEKSQALIKNEIIADFSSYVNSAKQSQQNFFNEFTNNSEKIRERMKAIDAGIDDLKAKAYTNVSEKLKMFEDDFFADLAKRSERSIEKRRTIDA